MKYKILIIFLMLVSVLSAQMDSIKSYYFTKDSIKEDCIFLLNKSNKLKYINKYKFVEIVNSKGNYTKLYPDSIKGYSLNNVYYKSFTINFKNKRVSFFAQEIISGDAFLYFYDGEKMDNEPIYIFRKKDDFNYIFVEQRIKKSVAFQMGRELPGANGQGARGLSPICFNDEERYLDYFHHYLSDCQIVNNKFESQWYSYTNIDQMFKDYNQCEKFHRNPSRH